MFRQKKNKELIWKSSGDIILDDIRTCDQCGGKMVAEHRTKDGILHGERSKCSKCGWIKYPASRIIEGQPVYPTNEYSSLNGKRVYKTVDGDRIMTIPNEPYSPDPVSQKENHEVRRIWRCPTCGEINPWSHNHCSKCGEWI